DESLNELYLYVVNKLENYEAFKGAQEKLLNFNDKFISLPKEDKRKVILEILKITQCNSVNANLSNYGGPERLGRIEWKVSLDKTIFIHQSITGLYEERVKL
ncbi:MAG: hypothetical protein GX190_04955, partial [Mollicutes bacterium]|nr:hypothetical protein [Mollicutes bacterium]